MSFHNRTEKIKGQGQQADTKPEPDRGCSVVLFPEALLAPACMCKPGPSWLTAVPCGLWGQQDFSYCVRPEAAEWFWRGNKQPYFQKHLASSSFTFPEVQLWTLSGPQCLCQPVPFQCFSKTWDMHEKCNLIYCFSNLASKFHFIFK